MSLNAASSSSPAGALAAALDGWAPGPVRSSRRVDPWPAAAFAALLDTTPPRRHAPAETVTEFAYRLVRPAFAGAVIEATAHRHGTEVDLAVGARQGGRSLTATATLHPAPERPRPAAADEVGAP